MGETYENRELEGSAFRNVNLDAASIRNANLRDNSIDDALETLPHSCGQGAKQSSHWSYVILMAVKLPIIA